MLKLANPLPVFLDGDGLPLTGGSIYVGAPNTDPEVSPLTVYWDKAFAIPAAQPLRTIGGYIVNGGNPASVFINADDYSIRVRDAYGSQIQYVPSTSSDAATYQPSDADLTAIAALETTDYGRRLLTLADQAALQAAVGAGNSLPASGGTVTGNIVRQGGGVHLYYVNSIYASGRVFGPENTSDPTGQIGDLWFKANG